MKSKAKRSDINILKIILDNISMVETENTGLCYTATECYVNCLLHLDEVLRFEKILTEDLGVDTLMDYAWPSGEIEPRKKWLEEKIEELKIKFPPENKITHE